MTVERFDEAADARRRLSVPAGGPNGMSRRKFLQALGIGAGAVGAGAAIAGSNVLERLEAFGVGSTTADDGILVLVMLDGGNDGLNTVIPYADANYRALRPSIRYDAPGTGANAALDIGVAGFGLHPSLVQLRQRYAQGDVAIVNGVGYTPPDQSHFTSMGYWMNGWITAPPSTYGNGWVGRYLDTLSGAASDELLGVCVGQTVPLHMIGSVARAAGLPTYLNDAFGMDRTDVGDVRMFDTVSRLLHRGDRARSVGRQLRPHHEGRARPRDPGPAGVCATEQHRRERGPPTDPRRPTHQRRARDAGVPHRTSAGSTPTPISGARTPTSSETSTGPSPRSSRRSKRGFRTTSRS